MSHPPTIVLKVGGANLDRPAYLEKLGEHVRQLVSAGNRVVLVHGGGPQISALHDELGEPSKEWDGLRATSERGLEITTMVLCGLMNKRLVAQLVEAGVPALGMSGVDLGLLRATPLDERRLGRVGGTPAVDSAVLGRLLDTGYVPVIAPVSMGEDGRPLNVNADMAARAIACALRADRLDFVTDVRGVKTGPEAPAPIRNLQAAHAARLLRDPAAVAGGMRPKLGSAIAALDSGVARVRIGSLSAMERNESTEVLA